MAENPGRHAGQPRDREGERTYGRHRLKGVRRLRDLWALWHEAEVVAHDRQASPERVLPRNVIVHEDKDLTEG